MEVLIILAPFTILIAVIFLITFIKSNNSGQFENLDTEQLKILIDDTEDNIKGSKDE